MSQKIENAYSHDEAIGMEAASHCALFKGDYKIIRNGKTYGDGSWRLYNLKNDPGEMIDLKKEMPTLFSEMINEYHQYTERYNIVEMGFNYEPLKEVQNKFIAQMGRKIRPWGLGLIGLILMTVIWRKIKN